ncbi:hypothetical protein P8452_53915 [Trifolium repens]|nr:hypothetical protein P8452_53915 [Trifolium repens]
MENKNGNDSSPVVKLSDCLTSLSILTLIFSISNPTFAPLFSNKKMLLLLLILCIDSQVFYSTSCNFDMMNNEFDNSSMQQKHNEWKELILEKGSEIVNILKSVSFELHVQEPFFTQLKDGLKTIEGRCASDKYNRIELGILLNKSLVFEVQGVKRYPSFFNMLEAENLGEVLPGVESVEEGVKIYRRFYTEEKEQTNGVLAITVSKFPVQPYNSLASLISGLSYEGVQGLLGLMHTTGTVPNALPPPISTLLASFNFPCNPNENALTDGARALAKHACRSSSGYWGSLIGNDSNKNRLAMDVINNLIAHCCWMNIHIVPPHGNVFEIRVADGYGARWTEDGSKSHTCKMVTQRDGSIDPVKIIHGIKFTLIYE